MIWWDAPPTAPGAYMHRSPKYTCACCGHVEWAEERRVSVAFMNDNGDLGVPYQVLESDGVDTRWVPVKQFAPSGQWFIPLAAPEGP